MPESLAHALSEAGVAGADTSVADKKRKMEQRQQRAQHAQISQRSKTDGPTDVRLQSTGSIREFKETAKQILLEDPKAIRGVVTAAHNQFDDSDAKRRLIALVLGLRNEIGRRPNAEGKREAIRQALRQNSPVFFGQA